MTFQPGVSGNPKGRGSAGENFLDRLNYWFNACTHEEIEELYRSKKKLKSMRAIDSMCITRLHSALQEDGEKTMEALLDRLIGKPTQHVTQTIHKGLSAPEMTNAQLIEALREADTKGLLPNNAKLLEDGTLITDAVFSEVKEEDKVSV